jgi:hypothetical protein
MILVVDPIGNKHKAIQSTDFWKENIWERKHIQEWVRHHPEILGEDLLIVSIEFDRFDKSDDRLDALAVDKAGNLVVIEFKRTADAGSADLQAIRYASMVSTLTLDQLIPYYADYLRKYGSQELATEDAKAMITEFVSNPEFIELSDRPRMILCAQDFGQELTTSVLWLRGFELDICCVRITPHRVDDHIIIVPERIIPLPEAQSYTVSVQKKKVSEEKERTAKKTNTFKHLLKTGAVKKGDVLRLQCNLPSYVDFDSDDDRFFATITGKAGKSDGVVWKADGQEWAISKLAHHVLSQFHPDGHVPGGVNGNVFWSLDGETCLWALAWGDSPRMSVEGE